MLKYSTAPRRHDDTTDVSTEDGIVEKRYIKLIEWPQLREVSIDVTKLMRIFADTDPKNAANIAKSSDELSKTRKKEGAKAEGAEKGWKDRSLLWLDIGLKKDKYRTVCGLNYQTYPSLDCKGNEKQALQLLFACLNGASWVSNRGWVGRMKTLGRPGIKLFEAEASQYFGIVSTYHRMDVKPIMALDKIITTIMEDDKGKKERKDRKHKNDKKERNEREDENNTDPLERTDDNSNDSNKDNNKDNNKDSNNDSNNDSNSNDNALSIEEKIKLLNRGDPIAAKITGINLSGNGCFGEIPPSIQSFSDAETLDLSWNLISGVVPVCLGQLSLLLTLDLSCNALSGYLQDRMFLDLHSLKTLDLSFNEFHGDLPPKIFEFLRVLEDLNLSGNGFHGLLPWTMYALSKLKSLKLYGNGFNGCIHESMSNLEDLLVVNVSDNRFTGGSNSFNKCPKLIELQLQDNLFTDEIRSSISNLTELKLFYIQNNKMYGSIPDGIYFLKHLKYLNLSNNNFTGTISSIIGDLTQLITFLVEDNLITGPLPHTLSKLTALRDFSAFKSYPSKMNIAPRGFNRRRFEVDYGVLPGRGVDCLCWDAETVFGPII